MAVRLSVGAGSFPGLAAPRGYAKFRREWQRRRWGPVHRRLATQPVFAACTRQEIRTLVRRGDEVNVDAGCVLWREDTIGYHFVVVESGDLELTRDGEMVGALRAGEYTGDVAILGFAPQPGTLTTRTGCRLFVVGRVALLSLVHTTGVRTGLFGAIDETEARERIRALRVEGKAEWFRRFPVDRRTGPVAIPESFHVYSAPPLAAPPRWMPREDARKATSGTARPKLRAAGIAAIAAAVLIPLAAVATTARPQIALVTPGAPIDVADDVTITGAPTYPVHGHYTLTSVSIRRPTYAQWILARFGHETSAPLATDQAAATRTSKEEFAEAKAAAVRAAASALSLDPTKLAVTMRALDLGGSSVSLVYALTIADLLDPADLARGRTIAATGQLDADGRVRAVRFVDEKLRVARAVGATMFLVPPGQAPRHAAMKVVEVATLAEAIAVLRTD